MMKFVPFVFLGWLSFCAPKEFMQKIELQIDEEQVTVSYPTGRNTTVLATEIVEKFDLSEGFGCSTKTCIVDLLATHLATKEPHSLAQWLENNGLTSEQVQMINDVMNINFWHYAMLNDRDRNVKFDLAIRGAVARAKARAARAAASTNVPGERPPPPAPPVCVIDLGAGSGLLAMMSARAGADVVHAVEQSALLSEVGPSIMRRNGFTVAMGSAAPPQQEEEDSPPTTTTNGGGGGGSSEPLIRWHAKNSEQLDLATDLGGSRCQVLVSETLGVSVHDEAGLHFMADVRQRLLEPIAEAEAAAAEAVPSAKEGGAKDYFASAAEATAAHPHRATPPPNGRDASDMEGGFLHPVEVIPARVVTYAAVVRCESLHELSWVGDAAGFDVSALNSFRHDKVRLRRMSKDWGFMLSEAQPPAEMVAGPYEIMTVNFMTDSPDDAANNPSEDGLPGGGGGGGSSGGGGGGGGGGGLGTTLDLPVLPGMAGEIHAVVAWFEAILDPHGDITLSTSPWAADNSFARQQHWGQLVELLPLSYDDDDDDDDGSSDGQVRSGGRVSGKPQSVEEGDVLRLTTNEVHGANAARSFSFPDVTVIRGGGGS